MVSQFLGPHSPLLKRDLLLELHKSPQVQVYLELLLNQLAHLQVGGWLCSTLSFPQQMFVFGELFDVLNSRD